MRVFRVAYLAVVASLLSGPAIAESPLLSKRVSAGALPPVTERLPETPMVTDLAAMGREMGQPGGDISLLMARSKDTRMLTVYGYARLVGFTPELTLQPDLALKIDNEGDQTFTLHLRPGHRWSDGQPFTTEDFRYFWEDIALNEFLSPFGPPEALLVNNKPPRVEVIDRHTIRYHWPAPNPLFLPSLAGARPLYIYAPGHYLKQFHAAYVEEEALKAMVEEAGVRNWAGLHTRYGHQYKFDNPDLPTLQPWLCVTPAPSERFIFERNPYFHRVDTKGQQLPYLDRVIVNIASSGLIPAKTGAGESDLQGRYLRLDNYPFLMEGGERNNFVVRLWQMGVGSQMAIYPNLNANDDTWRELMRDVRFRRALSLGIDRDEINQVIYFGLVHPSADTVLPQSPLFRQEYADAWVRFDLKAANALLDEIGLGERNDENLRLLPDGRPMEIVVHSAGESTEQTDLLELIHDTWLKLGIKIHTKPSQREVFRERLYSGEALLSIWTGLDNGLPTANTPPTELAPTNQTQPQWPVWGQYFETAGLTGSAPDVPKVAELANLLEQWRSASDSQIRQKIWKQMLVIHADQVFSIGTVNAVPQPIVVNARLRNVPEEGIYAWAPGAYFGMYRPDTFWLEP
ncbi:MAG: ABC transporter substrate-binding protein [Proteobacteria bacterium]|nr:ABC transporter substrate-binding protein [Pseudomonadota bacterium]